MGLISHVLCFKFNINSLLHQLKEGNTEFKSKGKIDVSPITLFAKEDFFRVASPRSPIFTKPVVPLMKMLSHLRSR